MFEGIFTAVISPMEDDGSLAWGLWETHLRRQIECGVHGIVVGGTTGEFYALSFEERIEQFKRAATIVKRAPWLAGVNALTTADAVRLAKEAKACGAAGLLLAAPPYSSPTQLELAEHCIEVDKAVNLPIVLYNYPGRTNADMGAEFMRALQGRQNFVALKESTGNIKRAQEHLREFPHIKLCCGSEDLALDFFAWGARMWICAASNFVPARILAFYNTCVVESDFNRGRRMAMELASLMSAVEDGGKFIAAIKYACERAGYSGAALRAPVRPLTSTERARLDLILDRLTEAAVRSAA